MIYSCKFGANVNGKKAILLECGILYSYAHVIVIINTTSKRESWLITWLRRVYTDVKYGLYVKKIMTNSYWEKATGLCKAS